MKPWRLSLFALAVLSACRVAPPEDISESAVVSRWELSQREAQAQRWAISSRKRRERMEHVRRELEELERQVKEMKQSIQASGLGGPWCGSDLIAFAEENTRLEQQMAATTNQAELDELNSRQKEIRAAMDRYQRDIEAAEAIFPPLKLADTKRARLETQLRLMESGADGR